MLRFKETFERDQNVKKAKILFLINLFVNIPIIFLQMFYQSITPLMVIFIGNGRTIFNFF